MLTPAPRRLRPSHPNKRSLSGNLEAAGRAAGADGDGDCVGNAGGDEMLRLGI